MKSQGILRALPFIAMFGVVLADLLVGPTLVFLPLLTLGPAFASVSGGVRRTAVVGGLSLLLYIPLAAYDQLLGKPQNTLTMASIVGVTGASMLASRLRARRERELANVRMVAEAAQRVLLRPVPRRAGDLRVALSYTSATAEAQIGGDLYEVVIAPEGVRLLIGDVQGKGLEAVETAAWVLGAFREAAYDQAELLGVAERLEASLARHLSGEKFVTAILAEVHDEEISLLNCGHPAPLVLSRDGSIRVAEPPEEAVPLGLAGLGSARPKPYSVPFTEGDQILFFTDGVIEARDKNGRFYPIEERAQLLRAPDPQAALDELRADLLRHVGGPVPDDAAMLLLRRNPAHPPSRAGEARTTRPLPATRPATE